MHYNNANIQKYLKELKKYTEISERIEKVIDNQKITKNKFAKMLGYSRSQSVYDIINGKSKPSFDFLRKLFSSELSENISSRWLLTGEGEMLKKKPEAIVEKNGSIAENGTGITQPIFSPDFGIDQKIARILDNKLSKIKIPELDSLKQKTDTLETKMDYLLQVLAAGSDQLTVNFLAIEKLKIFIEEELIRFENNIKDKDLQYKSRLEEIKVSR